MRVRHRIPSIFNLSMVDVLCCALGCVILLWLINLRDAKNHEEDAADRLNQTSELLARTQTDRDSAHRQLLDTRSQIQVLEKDKTELAKGRAALALALEQLNLKLKEAGLRVSDLEGDLAAGGKRIESLTAQATDLTRKLTAANSRAADLQSQVDLIPGLRADLRSTRDKLAAEQSRLKDQAGLLGSATKDLDALRIARTALERDLESKDKELALARPYKDKWIESERKLLALETQLGLRGKELASAGQDIAALRQEKKSWEADLLRARAAAENRFAGIALTGKRVIFLVDMSGSMDLVDEKTPAPLKWSGVRETVGKVMRSLPELEKFQVIVFAENASYLLGGPNQWFDFDPRTSTDRVQQALGQIKPKGGTNMYNALEAAFRFRDAGLDTIYLLSDGLPNMGEGVAPEVARTLKEVDLSGLLAQYIRNKLKTDWNSKARPQPLVRINAIGFFYESPDVGAFLWALARENDGSFVGMSKP